MAGIKANIKGMVMAIENKEFEKENGEILQYIKLKIHDKESKQTLDVKYAGEMEEFLQKGIEEYETYNITLEFSTYNQSGRNLISCKITNIER